MSKYGGSSCLYFPAFGLNMEIQSISPYSVRIRENTDQTKLRIWTHFTQCRELGNHFITKVVEGIKRLSGFTENPESPFSSSDLKRAFQYLGCVEMNLTNSSLMMIFVLSFMGFLRSSELSNLKCSNFILHNTLCQYS